MTERLEKAKERDSFWDNTKFILILFVVAGHFVDVFTNTNSGRSIFLFIYSFHMPMFLFVSGLFFKEDGLARRTVSYLGIFLALKTTYCIENYILTRTFTFSITSGNGMEWFMLALAAFGVITYLLRKVDYRLILVLSVLLGCFVGYDRSVGDMFAASRILVFFPFFYLATIIDINRLKAFLKKRSIIVISAVIIIIWGLLCVFRIDALYTLRFLFTGRNPFSDEILSYGFALRFLCYVISFVTGCALLSLIPARRMPLISSCGQKTIRVYYWHFYILRVLTYFGLHTILVSWNHRLGKIVWIMIAVLLVFALSSKPFAFPAEWIIKYSKQSHLNDI